MIYREPESFNLPMKVGFQDNGSSHAHNVTKQIVTFPLYEHGDRKISKEKLVCEVIF